MRLFPVRFNQIQKMLDFYSQFNPSPLSIKQFIDFGKSLVSKMITGLASLQSRRLEAFGLRPKCPGEHSRLVRIWKMGWQLIALEIQETRVEVT